MILTVVQLKKILSAGGGLVVDATTLSIPQIRQLVKEAATSKGIITLKNASILTADQQVEIALLAPGQIIFDITMTPRASDPTLSKK